MAGSRSRRPAHMRIDLATVGEASPPAWAAGSQPASEVWYFVNQYGEQWVARRFAGELLVSGMDIGWKELRLTVEGAELTLGDLGAMVPTAGRAVVQGTILNGAEALWLGAVICAALPAMRYASERS